MNSMGEVPISANQTVGCTVAMKDVCINQALIGEHYEHCVKHALH